VDFPFKYQCLPSIESIEIFAAIVPNSNLNALESTLSSNELIIARRFASKTNGEAFIFRRALLRILLGEKLSMPPEKIEFRRQPQGKPFLAGHDLNFSLTHSKNQVLIAISPDKEVGIDLEWLDIDFDYPAITAKEFTPKEKQAIRTHEDFYRTWVTKEAIGKALGVGITQDFNQLDATQNPLKVGSQSVHNQPVELGADFFASIAWIQSPYAD